MDEMAVLGGLGVTTMCQINWLGWEFYKFERYSGNQVFLIVPYYRAGQERGVWGPGWVGYTDGT